MFIAPLRPDMATPLKKTETKGQVLSSAAYRLKVSSVNIQEGRTRLLI